MSATEEKRIFRSAVTTFLGGAIIVIGAAITYCSLTTNTLGLTLMGIAVTVMSGIIYFVVRSES